MGTVRRTLALAAAAATLVLATACSDDEPTPKRADPTESTSSPTEPDEQKPWEEQSEAGQVAFAKHWIDAFNDAQLGRGIDELKRISDKTCQSCDQIIDEAEKIYARGGRIESSGWKVRDASQVSGATRDEGKVRLEIHQPPETYFASPNSAPDRNGGGNIDIAATMIWRGHHWSMTAFDQIPDA